MGDFRLSWTTRGGSTFFYGLNVIGATSDVDDFLEDNGGDPCIEPFRADGVELRGRFCPDLTARATFYHNISMTQEINDRFTITAGISNLFDTRPPRVSVINGGQISMLGPVVAASQYSFVGRQAFINVKARF